MTILRRLSTIIIIFASLVFGQAEKSEADTLHFTFKPESLTLNIGETGEVTIKLLDKDNNSSNNAFFVYGGRRGSLSSHPRISDSTGAVTVTIKAFKPGAQLLRVRSITVKREDRQRASIPIIVPYPPLAEIYFIDPSKQMYVGTTLPLALGVLDTEGLIRGGLEPIVSSSSRSIASLDDFHNVTAKKPGKVTITAKVEGINQSIQIKIVKNPIGGMEISS